MQNSPKKGSKKNKGTNIKPGVKILWLCVLAGFVAFTIVLAAANFGLFGKLPSLQQLENPQANLATEIYANDGKTLMGKIYAENRDKVARPSYVAAGVILMHSGFVRWAFYKKFH